MVQIILLILTPSTKHISEGSTLGEFEFDFFFQILARATEQDRPPEAYQSGPKVDQIIKGRVHTARSPYEWKSLVEEYHAEAALRRKRDLDKGQPEGIQRKLGDSVATRRRRALPSCLHHAIWSSSSE